MQPSFNEDRLALGEVLIDYFPRSSERATIDETCLFLLLSVIFDARFKGAHLVVSALFPRLLVSLPFIPLVLSLSRRLDRRFFRMDAKIFFD